MSLDMAPCDAFTTSNCRQIQHGCCGQVALRTTLKGALAAGLSWDQQQAASVPAPGRDVATRSDHAVGQVLQVQVAGLTAAVNAKADNPKEDLTSGFVANSLRAAMVTGSA